MPLLEAGLAAGASLLGAGINAVATGKMNKRAVKFAREMYARQYADQIAFWNMQNAYNSPSAQMQRFRDAGLNPNLVYGQSNEASAMSVPSPMSGQFETPRYGDAVANAGRSFFDTFYDIKMKNATYDNLRAQNDVIRQEALLKRATIGSVLTGTARKMFELSLEKELRDTSVDYRKQMLEKAKVEVSAVRNRDVREAVAGAANLSEVLSRLESAALARQSERIRQTKDRAEIARIQTDTLRIKENINLLKSEGITKQFEADLTKKGVRPNSPEWTRLLLEGGSELWNMIFDDE